MPGYVQCGLLVLPQQYAYDFLVYCTRNRTACPILDVTEPGEFEPYQIAPGADLRTDLPLYRVMSNNKLVGETADVSAYWSVDAVAFLIGSSLTFDEPLRQAGLEALPHVWVLNTKLPTHPAGVFFGSLVVTMRVFSPSDAIKAVRVSARFPFNHGAPIHIGDPTLIGADLLHPIVGPPLSELPIGMVPVYWACSVTSQMAVRQAQLPLAIMHSPGHGFITDLLADQIGI
jgi:uncharacterized protein YcsI (UPF0317 family)